MIRNRGGCRHPLARPFSMTARPSNSRTASCCFIPLRPSCNSRRLKATRYALRKGSTMTRRQALRSPSPAAPRPCARRAAPASARPGSRRSIGPLHLPEIRRNGSSRPRNFRSAAMGEPQIDPCLSLPSARKEGAGCAGQTIIESAGPAALGGERCSSALERVTNSGRRHCYGTTSPVAPSPGSAGLRVFFAFAIVWAKSASMNFGIPPM